MRARTPNLDQVEDLTDGVSTYFDVIELSEADVYLPTSTSPDGSTCEIVRVPKTGGAPTVVVPGHPLPCEIAVDSTHLYWTDGDALRRQPLDGSGEAQTIATGLVSAESLAVGDRVVAWADSAPIDPVDSNGRIGIWAK